MFVTHQFSDKSRPPWPHISRDITLVIWGLGGPRTLVIWAPFSDIGSLGTRPLLARARVWLRNYDIGSSEIYLLPNEMLSTRQQHHWYNLVHLRPGRQ